MAGWQCGQEVERASAYCSNCANKLDEEEKPNNKGYFDYTIDKNLYVFYSKTC